MGTEIRSAMASAIEWLVGSRPRMSQTLNQAKTDRSAWGRAATAHAVRTTMEPHRPLTVADVTGAPFVALGTREHAISALDGASTAFAEMADAMQVLGDSQGSKEMVMVVASLMDALDKFLGIEDMQA